MVFEFHNAIAEYYPYAFTIIGVWKGFEAKAVVTQWYSVVTAVVFLGVAFAEFRRRRVRG
jgi:lantibiotic transport system permease protein